MSNVFVWINEITARGSVAGVVLTHDPETDKYDPIGYTAEQMRKVDGKIKGLFALVVGDKYDDFCPDSDTKVILKSIYHNVSDRIVSFSDVPSEAECEDFVLCEDGWERHVFLANE